MKAMRYSGVRDRRVFTGKTDNKASRRKVIASRCKVIMGALIRADILRTHGFFSSYAGIVPENLLSKGRAFYSSDRCRRHGETLIRVHLLNFHGLFNSHIEIVLENLLSRNNSFYNINRWGKRPNKKWSRNTKRYIAQASSVYSFDVIADPHELSKNWIKYWKHTSENANALGENCAVATQWFLSKFASIPKPDLSNMSLNYLGFGLVWPSFIPCFVMLPGRVLSNAKFHAEAKNNPEITAQYSRVLLCVKMSLAVLAFAASVTLFIAVVLPIAIAVLSAALVIKATRGCVQTAHNFFKAKSLPKENASDKFFRGAENQPSNDRIPALAA